MGKYYVLRDNLLVRTGECQDGFEYKHKIFDDEVMLLGEPPSDTRTPSQPPILYEEKRRKHYPPVTELADALVKMNSGDDALEAVGRNEMNAYIAKCLAVKAEYSKDYYEEREQVLLAN